MIRDVVFFRFLRFKKKYVEVMIRDLAIIKDGVPLLAKNLSNSQKGIFSKENDLIMLSGFFSALNSFSDQFEDLGSIKELKLSKNNLKLLFLNDNSVQNLVYLASFDKSSNSIDVQSFLKRVSKSFIHRFGVDQIKKWAGRRERFETFEEIVEKFFEEEDCRVNDTKSYNKTEQLLNPKDKFEGNFREYYNFIPTLKISKKIDPSKYLTGDKPLDVFNQINGEKSIDQIAHELKMNQERVHAICKSLIKFGFISF